LENDKKLINTRWRLTKIILILASLGFFVPAVVNFGLQFFIGSFAALVLLGPAEWITIVTLIIGVYTSGNIIQDQIFKDTSYPVNKPKFNENVLEEVSGNVGPVVEDEGD